MAKKTVKKVDAKKAMKMEVSLVVAEALRAAGFVVEDGEVFGFTAGSLCVKGEKADVQVKLITPKAGVDHYAELVEEEAAAEESTEA